MKSALFLILIFSFAAVAGTDPAKICDPEATEMKLLKDWKKNEKKRYCLEAECTLKDFKMQREKCFFQNEFTEPNVVFVSTRDLTPGSMKSRAEKVILNPEEKCTNACLEGVNEKSCIACFKERALEYKEEEFINYPEIGRPIRRGTKCYYACQDKEGPIQKTRVLTPECISCVGAFGTTPESFEYLQTKGGSCFEFDSQRRLYTVNEKLCKDAGDKIHRTTYQSSKSVAQWLFNQKASCYEVDEMTGGSMVKIEVDLTYCGLDSHVNDSDRNLIKEEKAKPKTPTKPKTSKQ